MDLNAVVISMVSMGGLGVLFSAGLSIANKKLHVEEDPRVVQVLDNLPGVNCGGCGFPGCAAFAESIVKGESEVNGCPVNSPEGADAIAKIMGVEAGQKVRMLARVMCQGGEYETAKKGIYSGPKNCLAATFAGGGDKLCSWGCIGFGDCVEACPFDAMYMNDNGLPVVIDDKCTGCGNCVDACPRDIIELHPESHKLFVLCKSQDSPKEARQACIRACVGCNLCIRMVKEGQMLMKNNLAVINYDVYGKEPVLPTDRCPTDGLVVIDSSRKKEEKIAESA